MRWRFLVLLVVAGCRVPCDADENAPAAQITREQKAMYRGQPICRPLLAPDVTVAKGHVVLHAVKDNVLSDGELGPRLVQYREHFRAVRAGEPYDATVSFHFAADDPAERLVPLLRAAESAGIRKMHLEASGVEADVTVAKDAPVLTATTGAEIVRFATAEKRLSLAR